MTEEVNEQIINILTRINVEDPSSGVDYNQHIRGLYNWRDVYSALNIYYPNDVVEYLSLQYIRISQTPGNEIPTDASWRQLPGNTVTGTFYQYAESDAQSQTTSTIFVEKLTLTTDDLVNGEYRLGYTFEASNNRNGEFVEIRVRLNGEIISLPKAEYDNDYLLFGGFVQRNLSGVTNADIFFRRIGSNSNVRRAFIRRARLEFWRVE